MTGVVRFTDTTPEGGWAGVGARVTGASAAEESVAGPTITANQFPVAMNAAAARRPVLYVLPPLMLPDSLGLQASPLIFPHFCHLYVFQITYL